MSEAKAKLIPFIQSVPTDFAFLDLSGRRKYYDQGYYGQNVIVAVVDTGVQEHAELQGKLLEPLLACRGAVDTLDLNGHGSHVAGTIAGTNCGIAPQAKILSVKVMDETGSGYLDDIVQGLLYLKDWKSPEGKRVDIVSMSLAGDGSPYDLWNIAFHQVIVELTDMGIIVIVAAGNSGDETVYFPASFYECITVAAVDDKLKVAYFSTRSDEIDVCQVGVDVTSCNIAGGYIALSGTSMATPIVSGMAALIVSKYKAMFNDYMNQRTLYDMLKHNTIDLEAAGVDKETGAGFCTFSLPHYAILKLGQKGIIIDDVYKELDVAPVVIAQRTFTPTRHTHEAFGDKVEWLQEQQEVHITRY